MDAPQAPPAHNDAAQPGPRFATTTGANSLDETHCTFPGCQAPAHWADAHHLWHWIDGGPTDLNNAALLCGRHHTIVHRDQLAGTIIDGQVLWDRKPGSYQRQPATRVA